MDVFPVFGVVLLGGLLGCSSLLGDDFVVDESSPGGGGQGASGGVGGVGGGGTGGTGGSPSGGGGTGGIPEDCGDGEIMAREECDDGPNNGPGQACKGDCTLNVCGDGDQGPGEGCDNGAENGFELLRCAPDCSRIIEIKHVILSPNSLPNGNLGTNPVGLADGSCPAGYRAMFAFADVRRATTTPFASNNAVDWPVRAYTYYYNDVENPVWLTDDVPILGVRGGANADLENHISMFTSYCVTNLNIDGTTRSSLNCNGWTSQSTNMTMMGGWAFAVDTEFIENDQTSSPQDCNFTLAQFYCVEL